MKKTVKYIGLDVHKNWVNPNYSGPRKLDSMLSNKAACPRG